MIMMDTELGWFEVFIFLLLIGFFIIGYAVYKGDQEEARRMIQKCSSDYSSFECQLYLHRRQYIYIGN